MRFELNLVSGSWNYFSKTQEKEQSSELITIIMSWLYEYIEVIQIYYVLVSEISSAGP